MSSIQERKTMKKITIDVTCTHSINRKDAVKLVKKANQYFTDQSSVEIMGDFHFNSRYQYAQLEGKHTIYQKLKFYILERLSDQANDRVSIENQFII